MAQPNKSLGQHWLHDREILAQIADYAEISRDDTVLEIGPGLGTLTGLLLRRAKKVVAIEFDKNLASKLPAQFPGKNLGVINQDILSYDLSLLPPDYKVVGNIPYYITSKIVKQLMTAANKPKISVLLVQKEVAHRLAAGPGDMSLLAISAQVFANVSLGNEIPASLFTPPPKVDSQAVILRIRDISIVDKSNEKNFFRLVKAGFSAKRKMLKSSLAAGLSVTKEQAESWLNTAGISPTARAESLSLADWVRLEERAR